MVAATGHLPVADQDGAYAAAVLAGDALLGAVEQLTPAAVLLVRDVGVPVPASGRIPLLRPRPAAGAGASLAQVLVDRLVTVVGGARQELRMEDPVVVADRQLDR
ncbi:hypothetical protein Ssi03_76090 [Sphaerisporangium siamense]|nr:hypothetical protein Ssi03_76090 [Sphaerisporangium siamense]